MLIGGDDISNNVITLGTCFSVFVRHLQAKGFISNRRLYNRDRKSASKQATAVLIILGFVFVFVILGFVFFVFNQSSTRHNKSNSI